MKYFKNKECKYCNHKSNESEESNPFFCIFCGRKYDSFVNSIPLIIFVASFFPIYFDMTDYGWATFILFGIAWYSSKKIEQLNLHTVDIRLIKKWKIIKYKISGASNGELELLVTGGKFSLEMFGRKTCFNIKSHSVFRNRLLLETPTGVATWRYEINDGILTLRGADDYQNIFIEDFE